MVLDVGDVAIPMLPGMTFVDPRVGRHASHARVSSYGLSVLASSLAGIDAENCQCGNGPETRHMAGLDGGERPDRARFDPS